MYVEHHPDLSRCPLLHKSLQPPICITDLQGSDTTWELRMVEHWHTSCAWMFQAWVTAWRHSMPTAMCQTPPILALADFLVLQAVILKVFFSCVWNAQHLQNNCFFLLVISQVINYDRLHHTDDHAWNEHTNITCMSRVSSINSHASSDVMEKQLLILNHFQTPQEGNPLEENVSKPTEIIEWEDIRVQTTAVCLPQT